MLLSLEEDGIQHNIHAWIPKKGCLPTAGVPPDQRPSTDRVQTQDCRHLWDQTGPKNVIQVDLQGHKY